MLRDSRNSIFLAREERATDGDDRRDKSKEAKVGKAEEGGGDATVKYVLIRLYSSCSLLQTNLIKSP